MVIIFLQEGDIDILLPGNKGISYGQIQLYPKVFFSASYKTFLLEFAVFSGYDAYQENGYSWISMGKMIWRLGRADEIEYSGIYDVILPKGGDI